MIESTREELKTTISYPCLKITVTGSVIVLFTAKSTGTMIWKQERATNACNIGYHSKKWNEDIYKKYNGTITLKNEGVARFF